MPATTRRAPFQCRHFGTMPKSRGDFRHVGPKKTQIRDTETLHLTRKKTANGGLLGNIVGKSPRDWTGWLGTQSVSNRSPPENPANREKYREIYKNQPAAA